MNAYRPVRWLTRVDEHGLLDELRARGIGSTRIARAIDVKVKTMESVITHRRTLDCATALRVLALARARLPGHVVERHIEYVDARG